MCWDKEGVVNPCTFQFCCEAKIALKKQSLKKVTLSMKLDAGTLKLLLFFLLFGLYLCVFYFGLPFVSSSSVGMLLERAIKLFLKCPWNKFTSAFTGTCWAPTLLAGCVSNSYEVSLNQFFCSMLPNNVTVHLPIYLLNKIWWYQLLWWQFCNIFTGFMHIGFIKQRIILIIYKDRNDFKDQR